MLLDLNLYFESYELNLQSSARAFYIDEAKEWTSKVSGAANPSLVAEYLRHVEGRIKEETDRCGKSLKGYVDLLSKESLVGIVVDEFIRKPIKSLLEKGQFNLGTFYNRD